MSNELISGEFTGKTVQEAISEGLNSLGITEEQAKIDVLEEAKKGFLGIGATKAKVLITKIESKTEEQDSASDVERTTAFLKELFKFLSYDIEIGEVSDGEKMIINLVSENDKELLGRKAEILDSIQTLAGAVANIGKDEYKRVVVDYKNYRENREQKIISLAKKLASKADASGCKIKLKPMNPYERRIIHATLADSDKVKTQSEGKEPNRYVVIIPNNLKPYQKRESGKGGYRKNYSDRASYQRQGQSRPYKCGTGYQKNYSDKPYGEKKNFDRKKYEQAKKNYEQNVNLGSGTGTGTDSYTKKEPLQKKSYSSFIGTYLGNSRSEQDKKEE